MPRRRAVRAIGTSLVAIAVPGVQPRLARAATQSGSQHPVCPPGELCCTQVDANGKVLQHNPCGYPRQQYECLNYKCVDTCAASGRALRKQTVPTWSAEKSPDGSPVKYNCCPVPDEPRDGECIPSCVTLNGPGSHRCGNGCCPRTQRCVRSTAKCENCPPDRPLVCASECCDPSREKCLNVASNVSSGVRRKQCVRKCGTGKRHCIGSRGELGVCCPKSFPCCGTTCGCDLGEECVPGVDGRGEIHETCRPKCAAPKRRCNYLCCDPSRMRNERLPNGRTVCRCT